MIIIIYIATLVLVLNKFERIGGSFNFIFFFTLFHLVYTFMVPLEVKFLSFTRFSDIYDLEPGLYIFWSFIGYVGFIIPFLLMPRKELVSLHDYSGLNLKKSLKNLNYVVYIFIIIGLLFFRSAFIQAGTYVGNVELSENSFYKYYIDISTMVVVVCISIYAINKKYKTSLLLLLLIAAWSVYSSDKNPLFLGFIGFLFGLRKYTKKNTSFKWLVIFILILPMMAILFNNYRAGKIEAINISKSLYSNSDPRGPFQSIISAEKDYLRKGNMEFGLSYVYSTINWIPSSIWPSRPEDLAVKYAKENISTYSKGQGLGYSPIAEGVLNFGYFGPFFHYFFVASTLVFLIFKFNYKNHSRVFSKFIFYLFLIYFLVLMHRTPFNLPATFFRILLPLLFIFNIRKFSSV